MSETNIHLCVLRLDGIERTFLWESGDGTPDRIILDDAGMVLTFQSERAAREGARSGGRVVSAEPPTVYDFDAIRAWCESHAEMGPDLAINFDLFVARNEHLPALFPGSLPPRSEPRSITIVEVRDPFDGRLIAGPFEPPLVWLSYAPDSPWITPDTRLDLDEGSAQNVPLVQCAGLFHDGFEALGDALNVPRPSPNDLQRALGSTPERLTTPVFLPPNSSAMVSLFPSEFRDALAAARNARILGANWSRAFRAQRVAANAAAREAGFSGHEEPLPDAEQLRPYFSGLARDIVDLARLSKSSNRNLYVHHWPD